MDLGRIELKESRRSSIKQVGIIGKQVKAIP